MIQSQEFEKLLLVYSSIAPRGAPDFHNFTVLKYWYSRLHKSDIPTLKKAIETWIDTRGYFPSIADLLRAIGQSLPIDDDYASQMATRIIGAVTKFGYTSTDDARQSLDEIAWSVIMDHGGWVMLCELLTNDNMATMKAQLRDAIKGRFHQRMMGSSDYIRLEEGTRGNNKEALNDTIRRALTIAETGKDISSSRKN